MLIVSAQTRRSAIGAAVALAVGLAAPGLAHAHDVATGNGHAAADDVVLASPAVERQLSDQTVTTSAADSQAAAAAVADDPGQVGQWGPLTDWPVVAIHQALLPDGKVVAWDASNLNDQSYTKTTDHTFTRATVYDPATGTQTPAWVNGNNIFCAGLAHLMDGSLFTAGGNADEFSSGITATYRFDPVTEQWTFGGNMTFPRWYPSVTALPNGEMLITSGRPWIPEVRAVDGTIRTLSEQTASMDLPLYPWFNVAPDGKAFMSGPDDMLRELDPSGGGSWQIFGPRGDGLNRDYGGHALYDVGKILVAGGSSPSSKTAETIDINGATPQVAATSPMAFARRQFNLTLLADGSALATGGNSTGANLIDMNGGVYNAERWDPATGNWTTLAAEQVTRQYHSSALLLPDGRVLSGGGGICDECDVVGYLGKNAQIFSPPYLFKKDGSGDLAPRPEITTVPSELPYDAPFSITTPNAASIQKAGLIRLGAVTHSNNFDQRYVPLTITAGDGQLSTTAPPNANIAPPGFYMLFVVDTAGVPSLSKMVRISDGAPLPPPPPPPPHHLPTVTITEPADGARFTAPADVHIAATASDVGGSIVKVRFYNGTTELGHDDVAPFTWDWNGVAPGQYVLTAKAIDNDGDSSATTVTITVDPPAVNQPPTVTLTEPADGATFTAPAGVHLAATASDSDGSVTNVEFFNGTTKLGEDATAPYTFDWPGVGQGTYALTAKATDDRGATVTSSASTITVKAPAPNQPPTVALTQPPNGAIYTAPATVSLVATAADADGTVTKVEFFNGTTKLGEDATSPYTFDWPNVGRGTYTLTAKATDDRGATVTSSASRITVNQPPAVALTTPPDGASFVAPATVGFAATASDIDGSVAKVEFYNGTTKVGQDTTAPYSFNWTGVGPGTYRVTAVATDNRGARTSSTVSTITVVPNQPPTVSITSPVNGAPTFPYKATITITATAADPDGTVAKVEFRDGNNLIGKDTTAPYSLTWPNVSGGTHTLQARATDNGDATTTSAPVTITVAKR